MTRFVSRRIKVVLSGLAGVALLSAGARAEEACGICAKEIVINSTLADCFLDEYQQLSKDKDGAVAVDLTSCEEQRSVIEPLKTPGVTTEEPDLRFLLTQTQLACLKGKLEQPDLVLDPAAKIDLGKCE